jgi:hypothetical protein
MKNSLPYRKWIGTMTAIEFDRRAAIAGMTDDALQRCRRVLVNGESVASVAASECIGKERIYELIKRRFLRL